MNKCMVIIITIIVYIVAQDKEIMHSELVHVHIVFIHYHTNIGRNLFHQYQI